MGDASLATGDVSRYITIELSQAEFDVLTAVRLAVQAEILKSLTWPEFFLELARRVQ